VDQVCPAGRARIFPHNYVESALIGKQDMNHDLRHVTYGPKKLTAIDIAVPILVALAGLLLLFLGGSTSNVTSYGFIGAKNAGYLALFMSAAGSFFLFRGHRTRTPRIELNPTGITYYMSPRYISQAAWDSLKPFELSFDKNGRANMIKSQLNGSNVSENVKKEGQFVIIFPKLIDGNPDLLVSNLNDYRQMLLTEFDRNNHSTH